MKNFEVIKYGEEGKVLGDLVNVETTNNEVRVWYVTPDGRLNHAFREDIFISEEKEYVPGSLLPG